MRVYKTSVDELATFSTVFLDPEILLSFDALGGSLLGLCAEEEERWVLVVPGEVVGVLLAAPRSGLAGDWLAEKMMANKRSKNCKEVVILDRKQDKVKVREILEWLSDQ